jgi:hypothetical protein
MYSKKAVPIAKRWEIRAKKELRVFEQASGRIELGDNRPL